MKLPTLKRGGVIASLAVAAMVLSACTSAPAEQGANQPTPSTTESTALPPFEATGTVRVWVGSWWEPMVPILQEKWRADHPEITLEMLPTPNNGYVEAFTASVLGGTPPDVIDLSSRAVSTVASQKLLQPIDDVKQRIDVADYGPGMWIASTYEGVTYAIPSRASAMILYYNKKVFDAAGVKYPSNDWTYDDLVQVAKDLTVDGMYGIGLSADLSDPGAAMNLFLPFIWGHGGDVLSKDFSKAATNTPEFIKGLTYFTDFYKNKYAPEGTPNFNVPRDLIPLFNADRLGIFASDGSGRTALAANPATEYGMVLLPGTGRKATGWTMGIPEGANNPEAAKVFLTWLSQPEIQGTVTPEPPARLGALTFPRWNDPANKIFALAGEGARPDPGSPYWNAIAIALLTEVQKVLVGQETPTEAAKSMETEINRIIAAG